MAERGLTTNWPRLKGQFKLVITRGGKPELYDVVADPAERRDISAFLSRADQAIESRARRLAQDRNAPLVTFASIHGPSTPGGKAPGRDQVLDRGFHQ